MTTVSSSFESWAYAVICYNCATGYYSLAHELGHNMGARHDWFVDDETTPYGYAHGYVNTTDRWRTIMAYNTACEPGYCTRLQYWSNPNVAYNGDPMGVPAGTSTACTAGTPEPNCDADNRRTLNNTAYTVANFRDRSSLDVGPVSVNGYTVDDDADGESSGDADGIAECGETVELRVNLLNQGTDTATHVEATITTGDPYATWLYNTTSLYPSIPGGGTETNADDFDLALAPDTPHGHAIHFDLTITASNGGPWTASFDLPVACQDAFEPDDGRDQASVISEAAPQAHSIVPAGDQDWATFDLVFESAVVVETDGDSGDTFLRLYDGDRMVDSDDDGGSGSFSRIQRDCDVDPLPAGTYYVQVTEASGDTEIAGYELRLDIVRPCFEFSTYLPFLIRAR
jgi:hypothetical protein